MSDVFTCFFTTSDRPWFLQVINSQVSRVFDFVKWYCILFHISKAREHCNPCSASVLGTLASCSYADDNCCSSGTHQAMSLSAGHQAVSFFIWTRCLLLLKSIRLGLHEHYTTLSRSLEYPRQQPKSFFVTSLLYLNTSLTSNPLVPVVFVYNHQNSHIEEIASINSLTDEVQWIQ